MFTRTSKNDALVRDHIRLETKYNLLISEWNILVRRINARGGSDFLNSDAPKNTEQMFSEDELKKLLSLCHPDKHGGKKSANDITAKIISIRKLM